ncbi:PAS domain S-box-containing protein [Herbaspirillum sp. Sphag1AN]|uniref:PAS domain S-box protein n=1 Tax=unclassified Herbaspirillum TaxID=2624150 RepID=UPI0016206080|nr:PAS domain S-box-containing protein [Herbaspirillum sp. Sphag1AN]MBB3244377.1 PAS domain S-box-containing protein [Herbaspirillum sp. Sphag64]
MPFVTASFRQRRMMRALYATALMFIGTAVVVFFVATHQERDEQMHSAAQAMMSAVAQRAQSLEEQVASLSSDARFLSRLQTVSGLVRAMRNQGIDKEGGIPIALWQARLQNTFAKFAAENPHLMTIRFLSVLDDGRELVRIERRHDEVWSAPATQLLEQGNREDFALMANLHADTVAISSIHLEHLNGASGVNGEQGQIPALLAGMPVFSESGELTGMVEVSLDLRGVLAELRKGSEPGFKIYLINSQGDYLLEPEGNQASGVELVRRWQDEHDPLPDSPGLPQGLRDFSSTEGVLHAVLRRVVLDENEPGRYITIIIAIPDSVIAHQAFNEGFDALLIMLGVSVVVGGIAYFYRREHLRVTAKQAELAAIVESSRDAIIGKTLTGIVTSWNPAAEQMFGYAAAEAIGKPLAALIMPEASRDQEVEVLTRIAQGEMVLERRAVRCHKHGRLLDVSVIVSPIYAADGVISGAATNLRDISEQRTFETRIQSLNESLERQVAERTAQLRGLSQLQQAILDNAGYAIIAADAHGVITLFNPAAERMLGYRADEVVNQISPAIFHDPEEVAARAAEFSAELGEFVAPGFNVFIIKNLRGLPNEHEWIYIHKNGQRFPVLLSVTALRDEDGHIFSFVGLAADLSERKQEQIALQQLNQQLQIRTEEAESASRAKSEFLANMSHEIRTPMNAILGMLQLLQQSQLNAGQADYASKAEKAARTLLSIINDILDFSRVEAGKLVLDPHPFSMDNLLADMEALLSAGIGNKDVVLAVRKDAAVPDQLIGDALRLQQILINLVGNAIKFTSHGEVTLTLSLLEQDEQTVTLNFAVSDTGIGISEEQCKRIFEGFSQAEASTARRYGGSGLGLSISQRLVQLMDGSLHVESVQGQGSTFGFAVRFPRVMPDNVPVPAALESPPETVKLASSDIALAGTRRLTGLHLLVVDDNTINQQVACELLRSVDAEVDVADGGLAAVQAIAAAPDKFDAILMDIQMPDMDGYAATAEIRTTLGLDRLPIIAITANAMSSDRDKVIAAGMQDHVGKPFDLAQLVDVILYHCGRSDSTGHVAPATETSAVGCEPVFDRDTALARLEGNTALYAITLEGFVAEAEPLAQRLQQEIIEGQPLRIAASLHELRGIAAIAGASRLAATAKRLELILKQTPPAQSSHWQELESVDALIQEAITVARQTAQSMAHEMQEVPIEESLPAVMDNNLKHHLMDLQAYLREGDLDAVISFEQWFAEVDTVQAEKLAALEAAMTELDFPEALIQCQQLLERISADTRYV